MALVERHFLRVTFGLLFVYAAAATLVAVRVWQARQGWETEWIAASLVSGHGYSFSGDQRWLFEDGAAHLYFPSAWSDPVFPLIYAGLMWLFGDWSRLLVILLSIACFVVAAALSACTAHRIAGPWAGLIALASLFLAVIHGTTFLNASYLAALWISAMMFILVKDAEDMGLRSAALLGSVLGLSILSWSSTMILVPALVLLIFVLAPPIAHAVKLSSVMVLIATLLVAPWTLRNYLVFDEFVPVRNGSGVIAFVGTVGLGKTFAPNSAETHLPAPWTSSGPFSSVSRVVGSPPEDRMALELWAEQVLATQLGPELARLNEAQRDKWLLHRAREFVLANPMLTAQLSVAKLAHFAGRSRLPPMIAGIATVLGILVCSVVALRRRIVMVPLALTIAYAIPFTILVPYFARYRVPIEPAIAVLVGVAAVWISGVVFRRSGFTSLGVGLQERS